jgi:hypothetical protein
MTAVEDRTKPAPAMKATGTLSPNTVVPASVSAAAATTTCVRPRPKIWLRIAQSLGGRNSSPITNRNMTTPSSEKCSVDSGSSTIPDADGPTSNPAAK